MATEYGPLAALIGVWEGDQGMDVSPEPEGTEENPYFETWEFFAAGDVQNAESQCLAVVRYHQSVSRKSNREVFHDQVGYWTWDAREKTIAHSLTIPRRVAVLAGGEHDGKPAQGAPQGTFELRVRATKGDATFGILESPFMAREASSLSFEQELRVGPDELSYRQVTLLDIYGRRFEHVDENRLTRKP